MKIKQWFLDRTQKIFIGSLDAVCPSYTTKNFFGLLEVTEAGEAAEAENFPKNKYGSKCLELPNSARKAKKNFYPL